MNNFARLRPISTLLVGAALAASGAITAAQAATPEPASGTTDIVSVDASRVTTDGLAPSLSSDGRYVAYTAHHAPTYRGEVVLRDRQSGTSITLGDPTQANFNAVVSANGRFVFYTVDDISEFGTNARQPRVVRYSIASGSTKVLPLPDLGPNAELWDLTEVTVSANGERAAYRLQWSSAAQPNNIVFELFTTEVPSGVSTALGLGGAGTNSQQGSNYPEISGDGRFVTFTSAFKLVTEDTNSHFDVYLRELATGATTLISKKSNGRPGNAASSESVVSHDGRFIAYNSTATDLGGGQVASAFSRVYLFDRVAGATTIVTADSAQGANGGMVAGISRSGRFVALVSASANFGFPLNPNTKNPYQAYRYDRTSDSLALVSHTRRQQYGSNLGVLVFGGTTISADGRHVGFTSEARDLVIDPALQDDYLTLDAFVWSQ